MGWGVEQKLFSSGFPPAGQASNGQIAVPEGTVETGKSPFPKLDPSFCHSYLNILPFLWSVLPNSSLCLALESGGSN